MPTLRNKSKPAFIYNLKIFITLLHYAILSHSNPQKSEVWFCNIFCNKSSFPPLHYNIPAPQKANKSAQNAPRRKKKFRVGVDNVKPRVQNDEAKQERMANEQHV